MVRKAKNKHQILLRLLLAGSLIGCGGASGEGVPLLISTDVANGLIDTHGAQGSLLVSFDSSKYMNDKDFVPQDLDDGFMLAMALNLDAEGQVDVEAVIPTFGNATLPAEMIVARHIVTDLKGRPDIPVVPGAVGPSGQTLQPAPQWYDSTVVSITESFAAACRNAGVVLMEDRLRAAARPMTILATGPLTDVACLLTTAPDVAPQIEEIVVLASQIEGDSLLINSVVVNDFNFRMDPLGGALFLNAARDVDITLMAFALTGQTSDSTNRYIPFNAETLKGPDPPTRESERSLNWLLASSQARNAYWAGIFGVSEGPFDQYTLAAVLWRDLFTCQPGLAYVQQCPYPAWSPAYPPDQSQQPYNTSDNPCIDHGSDHGVALSQIPAQLTVTLNLNDPGRLIRGTFGIDGNLPPLDDAPTRPVEVCTDFASPQAFQQFKDWLYEYTW